MDYSKGALLRVGFELEKEDQDVKEMFLIENDYGDYEDPTDEYDAIIRKSGVYAYEDGSLDEGGIEVVSPMLALSTRAVKQWFNISPLLKSAVNAEYSSNCGGHMTISHKKKTAIEVYRGLKGWMPVLCALYPHRVDRGYSRVVDWRDPQLQIPSNPNWSRAWDVSNIYVGSKSHALTFRGAYYNKGAGLEIRLFDAPHDETDLLFRIQLLKYMMTHPARKVATVLRWLKKGQNEDGSTKRGSIADLIYKYLVYREGVANVIADWNNKPELPEYKNMEEFIDKVRYFDMYTQTVTEREDDEIGEMKKVFKFKVIK